MTIALATRWTGWSDRINPMVVRELRQAVNSRAVPGLFLVMLLVMVIALAHSAAQIDLANSVFAAGEWLTLSIVHVLAGGFVLVMPILAAMRLHAERHAGQLELVVATGLRFRRILMGKLWAAMLVELMVLSAALPFAVAATFLRGVDIPSVVVAVGWLLLVSMVANLMALGMACHTMGLYSIWFVIALTLVFLFISWMAAWGGATLIVSEGPQSVLDTAGAGFCTCAGLVLCVTLPMVLAGAADKVNRNRTTSHTAPHEWQSYSARPPAQQSRGQE